MTPAARVQAAIELLDGIIDAAASAGAAADTVIARYFASRRYAGSKDRRAIRDLTYAVIRCLGERPASGRAAMLAYAEARDAALLAQFGDGPHAPAPVLQGEPRAELGLAPAWLEAKFREQFGSAAPAALSALLQRAPLDLRVNRLKATPAEVMGQLPGVRATRLSPNGLRSEEPFAVESSDAFRSGLVEVQDEGSQLIALACDARPGMTVVDLCAGAGGKTLALAADMENRGRIIAADTDRARLHRLSPRAERAGASIIETRLLNPGREAEMLGDLEAGADVVLIDAPCSGTGTWRRNPEARWRLTADRLARLTQLQARLMDIGAILLKPGGRLVYAVCSLLPEEGEAQADAFESRRPEFEPSAGLHLPGDATGRALLAPHSHGTDGFFIAGYGKPC
jgi:16S rRNA (cytosine967-C5)-methyltransferase